MSQAPSQINPDVTDPTARRTAILVLGMHRSGTSALTQVLALAGCDLPQNVMPGDEHNAKGYFEPWRIAVFNDQRLRGAGSAWDDPFAHPYRPLEPREERRWTSRATDLFEEEFGDAPLPLMKDPRVTVLAPLWLTAIGELGLDVRVVIPVRHPLEVAGSLAKRNRFPVEKSLLLWSAYMLAAEVHSRGLKRAFVSYDRLLSDWRGELARVDAALGDLLPPRTAEADAAIDNFLTREMRHNQAEGDLNSVPLAGRLAAQTYDWFARACEGETADLQPLDTAGARLVELGSTMGVLVSPVTSELDAVKNQLVEARGLAAYEQEQVRAYEGRIGEYESRIGEYESRIGDFQRQILTRQEAEAEALAALDQLLGED